MAAAEEFKQSVIPTASDDDDDERASLKASKCDLSESPRYGSTDNVYVLNYKLDNDKAPDDKQRAGGNNPIQNLENKKSNQNVITPPNNNTNPTPTDHPLSLTRRMSSQFVFQVERQKSVVDNIGLTDKINQVMPDEIARHIPGLQRRVSQLKLTYFCNICFTKRELTKGFTLRNCQHQFCPECMNGFMDNKISNGVVNLTCFYPTEPTKACGGVIDEADIHQIVSAETWSKYETFKANLSNTYSRQCPFCAHTQNGDPCQAIMTCANAECGKAYCLYHSNAHATDIPCEEYELLHAKETKMNEMVVNEIAAGRENVKKCPHCNFTIIKSGGCNHIKCVKCNCSFCWLCMEVIEDEELPQHYKDINSKCKGQQFAGMEGEAPPKWIMALLVVCIVIFCIPSTVLGIAFGCICFPLVVCCECKNSDTGERQSLFESMFGCWLIWLLLFIVVAVFIPTLIFFVIWEVLKGIYVVIRICLPCLPQCPTGNARQPQVGGGGVDGDNPREIYRGNQGLLS